MAIERTFELNDITLLPSSTNPGFQKITLEVTDAMDQTSPDATSLPIITAAINGIIDEENWQDWVGQGIKVIIPKDLPIETRLQSATTVFTAFTIDEIKQFFLNSDKRGVASQFHIYVDAMDGHNLKNIELCTRIKQMYGPQVLLMSPPIFNADCYQHYDRAGVDYVRVSGNASLMDKNYYGFYYPDASLLIKIQESRKLTTAQGNGKSKVILCGGIKSHSDILKAIACGADYVMIGREFIQLLDSASPAYKHLKDPSDPRKEWIEEVSIEELEQFSIDKIVKNKFWKIYMPNIPQEIQAIHPSLTHLTSWKKSKPGQKERIGNSSFEWVRISGTLQDWVKEFREIASYGFLMTGAANWAEFKNKCRFLPLPSAK